MESAYSASEQVAVRQDSASRSHRESLVEVMELRAHPVRVPRSEVRLSLSEDSLALLPAGAAYGGRSGQASVLVSRTAPAPGSPGYIYIEATCDSLQLLCERYERTLRSERSEASSEVRRLDSLLAVSEREVEQLRERLSNGLLTPSKWFAAGFVVGGISMLVLVASYKHKRQ